MSCFTAAQADCCPGGWLQPRDLQMSPGVLVGWIIILSWIFCGVALGADVFMTAIERITSAETTRKVTTKSGDVKYFHVRVWNETMANLTLMALGSSAPEILLNVLESARYCTRWSAYSETVSKPVSPGR